jgi:hypothetical protein
MSMKQIACKEREPQILQVHKDFFINKIYYCANVFGPNHYTLGTVFTTDSTLTDERQCEDQFGCRSTSGIHVMLFWYASTGCKALQGLGGISVL